MAIPNLAIVSPRAGTEAETFIQQHVEGLSINFHFFGGHLPVRLLSQHKKQQIDFDLSYLTWFPIAKEFIKTKSINGPFVRGEKFKVALRKYKIKVLLVEYGPTAVECLPACESLGIPMIVYFHGYDVFNQEIIQKYKSEYLKVGRYASSIFVVSKLMKDRLVQLGLPAKKLILNPCCPHPRFLTVSPNYQNKNIISIGRFVDKKAPYYTLYAFKILLKKHPEAKLFFCGDGYLLNTCINLVKMWNIEKSVIFTGNISATAILDLIGDASIYMQHSITALNGDSEGTPVSILEAMAVGLPVISTIHSGIAEAVDNGVSGFLVEEHQVEKMAEKMIYLFDNPNGLKKMGRQGRLIIEKNYNLNHHIELIKKAINNSLKS